MSIESWKKEFYPVRVIDLNVKQMTPVELVEHSLMKWKGLLPENTSRHSLFIYTDAAQPQLTETRQRADGRGGGTWNVSANSCSLCSRYTDQWRYKGTVDEERIPDCHGCPLYEVRQEVRCDSTSAEDNALENGRSEHPVSPFYAACKGDPEPMIYWLERALGYAKAKEAADAPK